MTTAEDMLAQFVARRDGLDVPPAVGEVAAEACLDCIGVALAGSVQAPALKIQEQIRRFGGRDGVTVLGTALRASPMEAALANGVAAHALDYDDMGAFGHPTAVLLPALLALGEVGDCSGAELIEAYVVGFEVGTALNRGLGISRGESGLHTTGMIGVFAVAAAAARLLRLDEAQTKMAIGIAASTPSGLVQNFGTHTKSLHAGMAARNGVMAATLAAEGFTANPSALEGAGGMLAVYGRNDAERLRAELGQLGERWLLPELLTIKRFPCCGSTHAAINALRVLLARPRVTREAIEWVEVGELPPASHVLLYPRPESGFQGKFSIEYTVARALCDHGEITVESFEDGNVEDPAYRAAREQVRVVVGSKWRHGTGAAFGETTVTMRLVDGTTLSETVDRYRMPGTRAQPLGEDAVREKFAANCLRAGFEPDRVYGAWARLPELSSIREAMAVASHASAGG